jgi:hypothetical protein
VRERRRAPRYRCRLRCTLRHGRQSDDALVLDVSLSGLLVQTSFVLGQGDDVALEIADGPVRLHALAWHSRGQRRAAKPTFFVGMMLSDVGPDYEALVARIAGNQPARRTAAAPRAPAAGPTPETGPASVPSAASPLPISKHPPPLPTTRASWWRLRIKQVDGPRTRVVTLAAPSKEQAISQSLAELGEGWEVLEAVASNSR